MVQYAYHFFFHICDHPWPPTPLLPTHTHILPFLSLVLCFKESQVTVQFAPPVGPATSEG